MLINRRILLATRLVKRGFTFGHAIRIQLATAGFKMSAPSFYWMMTELEKRSIIVAYTQLVNGCNYTCYRYKGRD